MTLSLSVTKTELLDLLIAAIDGIDGYETEVGDLRYWNADKVKRAREVIGNVIAADRV